MVRKFTFFLRNLQIPKFVRPQNIEKATFSMSPKFPKFPQFLSKKKDNLACSSTTSSPCSARSLLPAAAPARRACARCSRGAARASIVPRFSLRGE
jgi:hypothetical protein